MKDLKIVLIVIFLFFFSNTINATVKIIPQPNQIEEGKGIFVIDSGTPLVSDENTESEAEYLASILSNGFDSAVEIRSRGKGIILKLNPKLETELGKEGYTFKSNRNQIIIEGATDAGVFYGIQTLRQLLPADFEPGKSSVKSVVIQELTIVDSPRFSWRAFMLDEARYFKGMDEVKKLLDQMALLKMNVFHWHLTDDQGWRIEIKKYPNLTKIGAYRNDSQTGGWNSLERSGVSHGGFYTQEQIKEIIAYAAQRHIQIVPEIEMPGHATAAIVAYPWLGTVGTETEVPVVFGKMKDSYNVADQKVYQFIEDVLNEVFGLFPGKVVHIGGDEVKFEAWKNSKEIQNFMKKEGLNSPADLQIFFTNQISNFIDKSGHRMMGWNEILGENIHDWQDPEDMEVSRQLAQSAIIHFWKGNPGLISDAAIRGYDIVNSFHEMTYLDYDYKTISLSKAYSFDPVPEGLPEKYHSKVIGFGCQMWGEWIPDNHLMELMVFPRLAAYAEVGWTQTDKKDYKRFKDSLKGIETRWRLSKIDFEEHAE